MTLSKLHWLRPATVAAHTCTASNAELWFFLFSKSSQRSLGQLQDAHHASLWKLDGFMLVVDLRITLFLISGL